MKSIKRMLGVVITLFLLQTGSVCAEDYVSAVYVDGEAVNFSESYPILINGRTMVPLREMFNIFQFTVSYHEDTYTISLKNDQMNVFFRIGDLRFFIEDDQGIRSRDLDVAPLLRNWRTYVPLRAIAEVMGAEVKWNSVNSSVYIHLPKQSQEKGNI